MGCTIWVGPWTGASAPPPGQFFVRVTIWRNYMVMGGTHLKHVDILIILDHNRMVMPRP